jgi:diacylglycerol kinase family enzyme
VLLNINARGVSERVRRTISRIVPEEHLFISANAEEADGHAATIIERRYDGVFSGGGDGSLVMLINLLWKHVLRLNDRPTAHQQPTTDCRRLTTDERPRPTSSIQHPVSGIGAPVDPYRFPMLGILKLGTGNGWAGVVGSKKGVRQLEHALSGGALKFLPFDLIETEGRRFHFSGLGWDAAILNDYIEFKKLGERFPRFKKFITTLPGYLTSTFLRTIPSEAWKQIRGRGGMKIKVLNRGKKLFRIEGGGRPVPARFGRGDIIYHGPANVVGCATTPNYGFNMKAFPYAMTMPGMMNLRIVQSGIPELVLNMGPIWEGTFRSPRFIDFLVSDVEIVASKPAPFHIGGDAEGMREEVRFGIASEPVKVLDFSLD